MSKSIEPEKVLSGEFQEHGVTRNEPPRLEDHSKCGACNAGSHEKRVNVGDEERIVSAISGVVLAAYGLTRSGPTGLLLAALGVGLFYRGSSGHCSAYKALDISTAE